MLVSDILKTKGSSVISLAAGVSVRAAASKLAQHGIGAVLVMNGERVMGILSERDIVRRLADEGAKILDVSIDSVMTRGIVSCHLSDTVDQVMEAMTARRIRHLPVIENGRIVGIVSIGDVVKSVIDDVRHEAEDLKRYIAAG
jgi:CBS domain-containing protein